MLFAGCEKCPQTSLWSLDLFPASDPSAEKRPPPHVGYEFGVSACENAQDLPHVKDIFRQKPGEGTADPKELCLPEKSPKGIDVGSRGCSRRSRAKPTDPAAFSDRPWRGRTMRRCGRDQGRTCPAPPGPIRVGVAFPGVSPPATNGRSPSGNRATRNKRPVRGIEQPGARNSTRIVEGAKHIPKPAHGVWTYFRHRLTACATCRRRRESADGYPADQLMRVIDPNGRIGRIGLIGLIGFSGGEWVV